ncbi:MAG: prolyl oligopeptidase family serine peptidase [Alphaproteobacteria bacterium]|nr:prolyl oligopeptidase family serine peptidase [Alphaproteobacteria bacterium]
MHRLIVLAALLAALTTAHTAGHSLADARRGHDAGVTGRSESGDAPQTPPPGTFNLVRYPAPPGDLAAYLSLPPKGSAKHPAIVWITGGDSAAIGDMWSEQEPKNDQTASAFRKAGIVLMVISLRGGNDNPGEREGLYGEVEDVKAAGDYLARQPYVDPARIYLGGHSTGGTLTLLTMAATTQFRAAFAFGPMATPSRTYMAALGVQVASQEDLDRRAPIRFLSAIATPAFIIEGEDGNAKAFAASRQHEPERPLPPRLPRKPLHRARSGKRHHRQTNPQRHRPRLSDRVERRRDGGTVQVLAALSGTPSTEGTPVKPAYILIDVETVLPGKIGASAPPESP